MKSGGLTGMKVFSTDDLLAGQGAEIVQSKIRRGFSCLPGARSLAASALAAAMFSSKSLTVLVFLLQVIYGGGIVFFPPPESIFVSPPFQHDVNGSSNYLATLVNGKIPTLSDVTTNPNWADGLIALPYPSSGKIDLIFNFTSLGEDYTGVDTIELVMLNCPDLKIGADNITVEEGPQRDLFKVVYNVTVIPNFCDHLLHVCLNVSTTHPLVGVMFRGQPEVVQWVHVAEVIFYGPEDPTLLTCPTNLVVPGSKNAIIVAAGNRVRDRAIFAMVGVGATIAVLLPASLVAILAIWCWRARRGRAATKKDATKGRGAGASQPNTTKKRTVSFMEEPTTIPPVAPTPRNRGPQNRSYSDGALAIGQHPMTKAASRARAWSLQSTVSPFPSSSSSSVTTRKGNLPALPVLESVDSDSSSECFPTYLTLLKGGNDPMSPIVLEEIYESIDTVQPDAANAGRSDSLQRTPGMDNISVDKENGAEEEVLVFLEAQISDSNSDEFTYVAARDIHGPKVFTTPSDSDTDTEEAFSDEEPESPAATTPKAIGTSGAEKGFKKECKGEGKVCTAPKVRTKVLGKVCGKEIACAANPQALEEEWKGAVCRVCTQQFEECKEEVLQPKFARWSL